MSRPIVHKDAHIWTGAQIGGCMFLLAVILYHCTTCQSDLISSCGVNRQFFFMPIKILSSVHILKCTGASHLDIIECAMSYCASTVFMCTDLFPQRVCYLHSFSTAEMNRNICFSMHWTSLRDVVINVPHLAQALPHSLDMFFERCNHIIQIHVFIY